MANYIDEDELKAEICKVQMTQKINNLLKEQNKLKQYAKYKWELDEINVLEEQIQNLLEKGADPQYSTNKFGGMVMLLLQRIATKGNFAGYSWKDEFFGDATEKIIKYLHNFDPTKISVVTGQPVKAFAYLTQIINMSFIHIINKHNDEIEIMKNNMPLLESTFKQEDILKHTNNSIDDIVPEIHWGCELDFKNTQEPPYIYNDVPYNSLFELLKHIRTTHTSVKCILHKNNIISLQEYNDILSLKFDPFNIYRFVYKNKFPPKQKKERKNLEDEWMGISDSIESNELEESGISNILAEISGDTNE